MNLRFAAILSHIADDIAEMYPSCADELRDLVYEARASGLVLHKNPDPSLDAIGRLVSCLSDDRFEELLRCECVL